jgi:hypothetical protein
MNVTNGAQYVASCGTVIYFIPTITSTTNVSLSLAVNYVSGAATSTWICDTGSYIQILRVG